MKISSKNPANIIDKKDLPFPAKGSQLKKKEGQLEDFHKIFASFDQIYQLAPHALKKFNSYDFSILVKASENYLIAAKSIAERSLGIEDQIPKMQKQFDELVKMMPAGPCVLLQKDIEGLAALIQRPVEKTFKENGIEYFSPKISLVEVTSHFQTFNNENGYDGVAVAMKRNIFYGDYENQMMTLVGFVKKKRLQLKDEKIDEILQKLTELSKSKTLEWGYEKFEVIHSQRTHGIMHEKIHAEDKYDCFVIFFHKRVNPLLQVQHDINPSQVEVMEKKNPDFLVANTQEIFQKINVNFEELYHRAPRTVKELSSYDFSLVVKQAEEHLIAAKDIAKRSLGMEDQIPKMQKQFDELVKMMPVGPCVLLQRDIDNLNNLEKRPVGETFTHNGVEYFEPNVSIMEITDYFYKCNGNSDFFGIIVAMKRDNFFGEYKNKMMTLIGLEKKKKNTVLGNPEKYISKIRKFAADKVNEWGYEGFEIILPQNVKGSLQEKINSDDSKYHCLIIFFHKRVDGQQQILLDQSKPLIEEIQEAPKVIPQKGSVRNRPSKKNQKDKKGLLVKALQAGRSFFKSIRNSILRFFKFLRKV